MVLRAAGLCLGVMWAASACEAPPAFPVPPGPPRAIAVDVRLPLYVVGTWGVTTFTDALRIELAKYRIAIVDHVPGSIGPAFEVDLGEFTYRQWQSIDVSSFGASKVVPIGSVRLGDVGMDAVEAAAEPVAILIARSVWGVTPLRP